MFSTFVLHRCVDNSFLWEAIELLPYDSVHFSWKAFSISQVTHLYQVYSGRLECADEASRSSASTLPVTATTRRLNVQQDSNTFRMTTITSSIQTPMTPTDCTLTTVMQDIISKSLAFLNCALENSFEAKQTHNLMILSSLIFFCKLVL
jgi:hypothetical protein